MFERSPDKSDLRTGYTTGSCAAAAAAAACQSLLSRRKLKNVTIRLPGGQTPKFEVEDVMFFDGGAQASVRKDAGDDPDVTHQSLIVVTVKPLPAGAGIVIKAGAGVGTVSRPGLPVAVGEPAVNPVPRRMICESISAASSAHGRAADFEVEIAIPGGEELAKRTWNPRLGIVGGLSILGTTGIVKPYSCAAWIASIHRGIDVARAAGAQHVAASTGSQSEAAIQKFYHLPDYAMLEMGDFAGGMLKYLRRHPLPYLTIAGGFGKLSKLAQGAMDLHSARSQVDFNFLGQLTERATGSAKRGRSVARANTAMQALETGGAELAGSVAEKAVDTVEEVLPGVSISVEIVIFDRGGQMITRFSRNPFPIPID